MTRVRVYNPEAEGVNPGEMDALLKSADCEVVDASEPAKSLLVILEPSLTDDEQLDAAVSAAMHEGMCVVGIWPKGATLSELPTAMDNYTSAIIDWNSGKLHKAAQCVCDDDQFDGPGGAALPDNFLKRHTCK